MIANITRTFLVIAGCIGFTACNLNENLGSTLTKGQADTIIKASQLLQTAYNNLQLPYQDFSQTWGMCEMTTDAALGPTRGGDWDDNGVWRELHEHKWTPDHAHIQKTFSTLLLEQFSATNVLSFKPTRSQEAEARFLRALSMFSVLDLYGQVPFRKPDDNLLNAPEVLKPQQAVDFIIAELTAIIPALAESSKIPAYIASKDAARFLLMKMYLNKGAFLNKQTPTFTQADMQQVIKLADEISASGTYLLANNYYDNFARDNDVVSKENIFTQQNGPGISTARGDANNVFCRWMCTLHYSQDPGGWNGFTTLSDFYDKFEKSDTRLGGSYPNLTALTGLKTGFLVGQQYDQNGNKILDRSNRPLIFTREVELRASGSQVEMSGIRVVKYPPDLITTKDSKSTNNASNDFVFFRYADVLLMKAEALLRNGDGGTAIGIVNQLRTKRGATTFGTLDLNNLLDERGRELFWEGWRRQDLIRFGQFLKPWQLKPTDDPKYLLFPIPTSDLAVNKNLVQNPGY
ncbi:RagB/SusD family nutrient uptake outer membrane protein [Chitinophaga nivalis]|uniref:RagB/SusD family nutrient uptake outer membrane protein n=1 Tax=Chitinophaga nivalis TaxID=2991709 RepID=A0ABT3IV01_9BACT|nr:RagB/SusD family nutrient uptake outer membrane protein [Chitinophaga nivalis]MCW3462519.1 RagB/SusD family nutrient uptake outer membrane protein [Chitinophaga nivalis]MCW3487790.1 RagB/SusD family nutrient uptake outer membrane protein [Chitinophaga nivalis]